MLTFTFRFRVAFLSFFVAGSMLSCSTVTQTDSNDGKSSEKNDSSSAAIHPLALNGASESKGGIEGACFLMCEGKEFACANTVEKRCVDAEKYELFHAIPRCPHALEFRAGETCK